MWAFGVCVYDCIMSVHIGLCVHTQHNSHQALWFQGQKEFILIYSFYEAFYN